MRSLTVGALSEVAVWLLAMVLFSSQALAHAFPIRSEPRVGWTIPHSPPRVKIWFDGELKPAVSTIAVYNSAKKKVDKGDGGVDPADPTLLEVALPKLPPGTYRVYWNVVAKDSERTEGDFPFTISGQPPP
ncbi:MAG: copper resistance protein CopC [Candidatus Binatia bacterium]